MNPRPKKVFRWLSLFAGVLLLLLGLFLVEEHVRGRIQLRRYLADMKARGEKFAIKDLTPAPAPPALNGAGPFLAAGFASSRLVPNNLPASMRYAAPGAAIVIIHRSAWTLRHSTPWQTFDVRLRTNGVTALWHTQDVSNAQRGRGRNIPMLVTKEDLAAEIETFSNSLAQVYRALEYPMFDFGVNYSAGFTAPLSHLVTMKAPANWLRAASLSALYETNLAASFEHLLALASLSCIATNEPLIISQLVRMAIFQIAANAVWEALQAPGWTDAQLAELQTAYGKVELRLAMTRAFEMERAMGADMFDRATFDAAGLAKNTGMLETDLSIELPRLPESYDDAVAPIESLFNNIRPAFNRFVYVPVWSFAWKDQDKLNVLKYWQDVIDAARKAGGYSENARPDNDSPNSFGILSLDGNERSMGFYDRTRYLFSWMLTGLGDATLRKVNNAQATRELLLAELALRRYDLAQGKRPELLSDLVPQYLDAIPIDPWDGKPIRYRRKLDRASVLYSVGQDGRDDGGDASPAKAGQRPNFINGRDLVWPRAATAEEVEKFVEDEASGFRKTAAP